MGGGNRSVERESGFPHDATQLFGRGSKKQGRSSTDPEIGEQVRGRVIRGGDKHGLFRVEEVRQRKESRLE